jgi:hypothetical protein
LSGIHVQIATPPFCYRREPNFTFVVIT